MKKIILAALLSVIVSLNVNAQNYKNDGQPYWFYCEMIPDRHFAGKLRMTIQWDDKEDTYDLRDENGEKIEFTSSVEMINYMSKRGWELKEIYRYSPDGANHFLFRKQVRSDEEAKEGLYFKDDFKK